MYFLCPNKIPCNISYYQFSLFPFSESELLLWNLIFKNSIITAYNSNKEADMQSNILIMGSFAVECNRWKGYGLVLILIQKLNCLPFLSYFSVSTPRLSPTPNRVVPRASPGPSPTPKKWLANPQASGADSNGRLSPSRLVISTIYHWFYLNIFFSVQHFYNCIYCVTPLCRSVLVLNYRYYLLVAVSPALQIVLVLLHY